MCTVTIVPKAGWQNAFRMACSRDESHGRAPAYPPSNGKPDVATGRMFLMPTDPKSGGTWVAVNDAGVALTLLNHNLPDPPSGRELSRGDVIPTLLQADSVEDILWRAAEIPREQMMPFRLVACDGTDLLVWRGIDPIGDAELLPWDGKPVMFTSSGLGDHLVEGPRRELFEGWFGQDPADYFSEQAAFHKHQWPGKEHLSVCMHREDARTVSYTVVDVDPTQIAMRYHPDRPDREADDTAVSLRPRLTRR